MIWKETRNRTSKIYPCSDEKLSERFILGLRLVEGIDMKQLKQEFGDEAVAKYNERTGC